MSVLVTGGAGYIGSHMVWALVDAGEDVVVVDRLSTGFQWAIAPEARFIHADIADTDRLAAIIGDHGVEAIIHFAGSVVVPDSVSDPLGYYQNNTVNSLGLIRTAVACGVPHLVFSSTAAVYGTPDADAPVVESDRLQPQSPYGVSKLMTELMLRDTSLAHGLRYAALRYFNVAGADPRGRTGQSTRGATHLLKTATEAALGKRSHIDVFGTDYPTPDGTCVRDYIHVTDLVAAHLKALSYLRGGGESLVANCGYGRGYSVLEVLAAVRKVHGADFDIRMAGRRAGDATSVVADATLARTALGWVPEHDDLEKIVRTALDWEASLSRRNQM